MFNVTTTVCAWGVGVGGCGMVWVWVWGGGCGCGHGESNSCTKLYLEPDSIISSLFSVIVCVVC